MFTATYILLEKKIKNAEDDGWRLFYYNVVANDVIASAFLLWMICSGHIIQPEINMIWATIYMNIVVYSIAKGIMAFLVSVSGILYDFLKKKYKECYAECEKK